MKCYLFRLDFQVRDYECDLQGIVNNAVYQNYLEHTRHEYLKTVGLDFAELSQRGIDLVLTRAEKLDRRNYSREQFIRILFCSSSCRSDSFGCCRRHSCS